VKISGPCPVCRKLVRVEDAGGRTLSDQAADHDAQCREIFDVRKAASKDVDLWAR